MKRFISFTCLIILGLWLLGCDVPRGEDAAGDIAGLTTPDTPMVQQNNVTPTAQPEAYAAPPEWVARKDSLPVAAQASAITRLEPASIQLNPGDVTAIQIRVDGVTDLVGVDVSLQFDPAILQVQDANPNQEGVQIQPGDFPLPEFVVANVVSNTVGTINYAASDLAPFQPVDGGGIVATINFQALAQGSSAVNITQAILVNSQVQSIPTSLESSQITVGQGPTSTPTFTPIPGQATPTFTPIVPTTLTPIVSPTTTPFVVTATPTPTLSPTPLPTATNTPAAPAVQIPPGATVGVCYRVQPGDTLYSLAQTYGTDPYFISLANDLYPPGHIYPQQVLFMPTAYGNGPNVYAVQANDTLVGIAEQCQLKVDVLAYVNGLAENANLAGLEFLIIPRPPYAPPSRYPYPQVGPPSVWPPPCSGPCGY